MAIYILDNTLKIHVFFDKSDCEYNDNICLSILEECPEDEKLFIHDETNIYLTPEQARRLANALLAAADDSCNEDETNFGP
jgi:NAD-dependent dihydropyrimidine dehydrogenase PreA subunit